MAEIQPFRGVLYNTEQVRPDDVLTQPYDKVTPEMRERYLKLSPYNLIRIELGKEEASDSESRNKYTRACDLYQAWVRDGVLRRSSKQALYYLEQTFAHPTASGPSPRRSSSVCAGGTLAPPMLTRKALIARVRLHRWDEGVVLPHEHTLSKPKADRMALLRACGSQQGQIFMLYPSKQSISDSPVGTSLRAVRFVIECTDDYGVVNKLGEITDPAAIKAAQDALRDSKFYIADGHHRYETALAYRDECRAHSTSSGQASADKLDPNAPYEFVMATLVDMHDPGLVVLPTHRAVANLSAFNGKQFRDQLAKNFAVEPQPTLEKLLAAMKVERASSPFAADVVGGTGKMPVLLGLRDAGGFALLRPKNLDALRPLFTSKPPLWHTLDVAILHVGILEALLGIDEVRLREEANVTYWREPEKAVELVQTGIAQLVFFLNPTDVEDVRAIADARSRMPQKSTDFYPKLLSGIVINDLHDGVVAAVSAAGRAPGMGATTSS